MSLNFLPPPLEESKPFESFEEEAILSIALDIPDYFMGVAPLLNPELFNSPHVAYAISFVIEHIQKYQSVPTRNLLWHTVRKHLTTDSDAWEDVERIIKRPADPRDLPSVKDTLTQWAKRRSYGLLYSEEAQEAYAKGDYAALEKIVNDANKISDNVGSLFWFYDQVDELFEPDASIHMKTGYPALDKMLNNGGPSPKEVVCWMAPTGVGKCHTLQSKIYEEHLSRIYELEMEDGTVRKLAGYRTVQTTRGGVRVCDLTEGDDIESLPPHDDAPDLRMPAV